MQSTSNVTEPIKGTTSTTSFKLMLALLTIGPLFIIGLMKLADVALQPEDAKLFKAPLMGLWSTMTGSSVISVFVSSLAARFGKIAAQTKQAEAAAVVQQVAATGIAKVAGKTGIKIEGAGLSAAILNSALNEQYTNHLAADPSTQLAAQAMAEQEAGAEPADPADDEGLQTTGVVTPD